MEHRLDDDHKLSNQTYNIKTLENGAVVSKEVPALSAINMRLRDDYVGDAMGGLNRWNRTIKRENIDFVLKLPHEGFNRSIGVFAGSSISPAGDVITRPEWEAKSSDWLPTTDDANFIVSLMKPCHEIGKYASWIAPPKVGINNQAGDFEYVQLHMA